jgi:acetyl/propionyl-CoA carboxylase alpha subunit/acetyl-CoA carboxylase carboxyltransferase component
MTVQETLLIANRGEIAIRIARAAEALGIRTVAVHSEDDATCLHTQVADEAISLKGSGVGAYLDIDQLIEVAKSTGCTMVHPGYGFVSENAAFAHRCNEAGITFVGPTPDTIEFFGDKGRARSFAEECGVPIIAGISKAVNLDEARDFYSSLPSGSSLMIKAIAGGGGRGMRLVHDAADLEAAYNQCVTEATAVCGNGDVYVEQYLPAARHIEIQIIGDDMGNVSHIWDRDCSVQRRHQKLVEVAPSPNLNSELRQRIIDAALTMAEEAGYRSLGTFEFLVNAESANEADGYFAFIEVNPRLQVEHTVTEAVTGIDLVQAQIKVAQSATLDEIGLEQSAVPAPNGFAMQTRINMETLAADGSVRPSSGLLAVFEPPSDSHYRVDTLGYPNYEVSPRYDSLLAKLIGTGSTFEETATITETGLGEFGIEGVSTNTAMLRNLLKHPKFVRYDVSTSFIDEHVADLVDAGSVSANGGTGLAGAKVDAVDPLAVLDHGSRDNELPTSGSFSVGDDSPDGIHRVNAPMQGTVVEINVDVDDIVHTGTELFVLEAMKMQHIITAEAGGIVKVVNVKLNDTIYEGHPMIDIEEADVGEGDFAAEEELDLDYIRPDLQEVFDRAHLGSDANRTERVNKRHALGLRTAHENLADLVDPGTYIEYGSMVIAAQRLRRDVDDLIVNTPADGFIGGLGSVNGAMFDEAHARCCIMSYDYMVLAGTQGKRGHQKKDRMFEIAKNWQLPVILIAEGGGGRPGDTDGKGVAGLNCLAFAYFSKLSGLVPMIGITTGRCFAGNAVLLGCCDVIIATEGSNIGIGGPAMIEGGGLGVYRPEEVGPMDVQVPNGVVDIAVKDEAEACQVAKKYLSYFQGPVKDWECDDQRKLRFIIPENRLRVYDIRQVIETISDTGSMLELRRHFGHGIITAFARIEGRPVGFIANNPAHLAGAIDREGADKGARFMQLCDAFDIPIVSLCDCPGIMVGPESETTALVRHATRMFNIGANIDVPLVTIVIRKAYGLGAQAMAGGGFHSPIFTVSWPTGEFGGMGLEGSVKLGFRKELMAVEDPEERKHLYEEMVARAYENGKATNTASYFEVDEVIDPKDTRHWIMTALKSVPPVQPRKGKKRPWVDTW